MTVTDCRGGGDIHMALFVLGAAAQQAVPRRAGASLANPNKAARRVTAVEFSSDSDD